MSESIKFNQHGQWQLLEKASSAPPPVPAGHPSDVTPRPKGVPPLVPPGDHGDKKDKKKKEQLPHVEIRKEEACKSNGQEPT